MKIASSFVLSQRHVFALSSLLTLPSSSQREFSTLSSSAFSSSTPSMPSPHSPYQWTDPLPTPALEWQVHIMRRWSIVHILLAAGGMLLGGALVAFTSQLVAGIAVLVLALSVLTISAFALRFADVGLVGGSGLTSLTADLLLVIGGTYIIGQHLELCLLLPGSLLLIALVADRGVALTASLAALLTTLLAFLLTPTAHIIHPDPALLPYLLGAVALLGLGLFATILSIVATYIQHMSWRITALAHQLDRLQRERQQRSMTFDADAIALQEQLTRALRGEAVTQIVVSTEELVPLGALINSANHRIPHLLQDREERLRLERAIRALNQTVEQATRGERVVWPTQQPAVVAQLTQTLQPMFR